MAFTKPASNTPIEGKRIRVSEFSGPQVTCEEFICNKNAFISGGNLVATIKVYMPDGKLIVYGDLITPSVEAHSIEVTGEIKVVHWLYSKTFIKAKKIKTEVCHVIAGNDIEAEEIDVSPYSGIYAGWLGTVQSIRQGGGMIITKEKPNNIIVGRWVAKI